MSHSELASRFEDGPTVLYRALLKGLGLEAFEGIRECLAKAQAARRKQKSEAKDTAKLLIEEAKGVQAVTPDERIAETITLLGGQGLRPRSARRAGHRHQRRSGVAAVAARPGRAREGARRRGRDADGGRPALRGQGHARTGGAGSRAIRRSRRAAAGRADADREDGRHRVPRVRDAGRDRRRLARAHGRRGDAAPRGGEGAAGGAAAAARAGARRAGAVRRATRLARGSAARRRRGDARARRVEGVARRAEDRGRRRAGRASRAARRAAGVRAGGARRVGRARDRRAPGRLAADRAEARAVGRSRARRRPRSAAGRRSEEGRGLGQGRHRRPAHRALRADRRHGARVLGPDAAPEQRRSHRDQARRHAARRSRSASR